MKKIIPILSLLAVIIFLFSCEKQTINPVRAIDLKDTVYFQKDIVKGIFEPKCIGCHVSGGSGVGDFTSSKAFNTIINLSLIDKNNPSSSKLVTHHNNLEGHGGTSADRQLIINWIAQGAKNN